MWICSTTTFLAAQARQGKIRCVERRCMSRLCFGESKVFEHPSISGINGCICMWVGLDSNPGHIVNRIMRGSLNELWLSRISWCVILHMIGRNYWEKRTDLAKAPVSTEPFFLNFFSTIFVQFHQTRLSIHWTHFWELTHPTYWDPPEHDFDK